MPLEKADQTATMRFTDGAAWLILRTKVTKGEADRINDLNSRTRVSAVLGEDTAIEMVPDSREVNRTLFDILAVEWSLGDGKPTARDYEELTQDAAEWVDECISKAIRAGRGGAEGNSSSSSSNGGRAKRSSKKPASSPTTSPVGAASS